MGTPNSMDEFCWGTSTGNHGFFGAPQDPAVSHWSDDPLGQDSHNGLEWMLSPLKHGNWKAPTSGGFSKGKSGKKGMLSYLNSMFFTVSNTICWHRAYFWPDSHRPWSTFDARWSNEKTLNGYVPTSSCLSPRGWFPYRPVWRRLMVPKRFWGLFFELTVFARLLQRKVNIFNEWRVFAPHFNLSFQHPSFPSCVWLRIQCSPFPLVFLGRQKIPAGSQTWLAGKFPMKFDDREILAVSPFHPLFSRQHLSNMSFQKPQYPIKVPLFNYYIMHIPSYSMSMELLIMHNEYSMEYSMHIPWIFPQDSTHIPMVSSKP